MTWAARQGCRKRSVESFIVSLGTVLEHQYVYLENSLFFIFEHAVLR